jgi:hypothetical protein
MEWWSIGVLRYVWIAPRDRGVGDAEGAGWVCNGCHRCGIYNRSVLATQSVIETVFTRFFVSSFFLVARLASTQCELVIEALLKRQIVWYWKRLCNSQTTLWRSSLSAGCSG